MRTYWLLLLLLSIDGPQDLLFARFLSEALHWGGEGGTGLHYDGMELCCASLAGLQGVSFLTARSISRRFVWQMVWGAWFGFCKRTRWVAPLDLHLHNLS